MTNMSKRGDEDSFNRAPGQVGRTDIGYENLQVNCLKWPDKLEFGRLMSKASVAVRGNIVGDEEIDEEMAEDMLKGGLNQCLEWFTVVFEISGVTRGVTHQLVRTRKASFTQQSMRYADMGSFNARMPSKIAINSLRHQIDPNKYPILFSNLIEDYEKPIIGSPKDVWEFSIEASREAYAWLAEQGIPMQDARTVCPIATETYIICNYPLSEFINTFAYRGCSMFYPETVQVFRLMREKLLEKCPWLEPHIKISCEKTTSNMSVNGQLLPHKCTYQGWERVEGECGFPWALEDNRVYKSRKVEK